MRFEAVVESIPTLHALKRTASAHVVDYVRLGPDELRASILRTMNQYTHPESVAAALNQAFHLDADLNHRVLSPIIVRDVLLEEYGCLLPYAELEEKVRQIEQAVVDSSNEKDLKTICGGRDDTEQYKNTALYYFVLETAWQHQDTKSVDEANLLRQLRTRLRITLNEERLLEAMLGKFPKPHNELHTRDEIVECVRHLEGIGIVFEVRDDNNVDFIVIPEEVVSVMKSVLGMEIRRQGYLCLLQDKRVRQKAYLEEVLCKAQVPFYTGGTRSGMQERVVETVCPSKLLGGYSPHDGLSDETLREWCAELGLPVSGKKAERIERLIAHYNQLDARPPEEGDEREVWYRHFEELARRDYAALRTQHVIERDSDTEDRFEAATAYIFDAVLNHTPLRQAGTEHSDGLLSFRDTYVMWDNKSSETPVALKAFLRQFDSYMDRADKPVPIFLLVAPDFTPDSEVVSLEYTAEHIGRCIALVPATELRRLAEFWSSDANTRKGDPFPLGLFARPGRFSFDAVKPSLA